MIGSIRTDSPVGCINGTNFGQKQFSAFEAIVCGHHMHWSDPLTVPRVGVGAFIEQELHNQVVIVTTRPVQGTQPVVVPSTDSSAGVD